MEDQLASLKIKAEEDLKHSLTELALVLLMVPLAVLLRGVVLYKLWEWFVVQFANFQPGIVHCIGIALTVSFLVPRADLNFDKPKKSAVRIFIEMLVTNGLTILLALLIKGLM